MEIKYPVYKPYLKGNEKKYVNECLDSSWISSRGSFINLFEKNFADFLDVRGALSVSNGTVALHLALLALEIKKGDEVIVPTLTYIASVNAIKYVDATPVFVDSRVDTWQIDHEQLEKKITSKTKAIIVVHLYGHPCEMTPIIEICKKHKLFLIEDCAESIGSEYKNKKTGTFGDIAAFSFYGNKTITTGEGGMVVSNNARLLDKVYSLKMQSVDPNKQYWHSTIGYNYRMTNICAAIGLAQLENIKEILNEKRNLSQAYCKYFTKSNIKYQRSSANVFNTYWMFSVLVPDKADREEIRKKILSFGIETRPVFYPVHTMPMYNGLSKSDYPVASDISAHGINLPSYPGLSEEDIFYIAEKVTRCIDGRE